MIVTMRSYVTDYEIELLQRDLRAHGYDSYRCRFGDQVTVVAPGVDPDLLSDILALYAVERTASPGTVPPLVSMDAVGRGSVVRLGSGVEFGTGDFVVVAGPCAVEGPEQLDTIADLVAAQGAAALRGGAFKPRTSPYAFQGLGRAGLELLAETSRRTGLPVVTEVLDPSDVDLVAEHAHMLQIGARNAQNFPLLREVARTGLPVLLKRGFSSTVDEWLNAAEYILCANNANVVLCERGIRTFEGRTRFTLDLSAVALVKQLCHLPVIVDPSHATGNPDLVGPLTLAALAAGADGVLLDVHHNAAAALCDGAQALHPAEFGVLMGRLQLLLPALDRQLAPRPEATAAKLAALL